MPTINGTAILADGSPLALAVVSAFPLEHPAFMSDGRMVSRSVVSARTASDGTWAMDLLAGAYRISIAGLDDFPVLVPETGDELEADDLYAAYDARLRTEVLAWAIAEAFSLSDPSGLLLSTTIVWPDGIEGVYTCTSVNEEWGVPDAFTLTYPRGAQVLTITQAQVTRNADGVVTFRPDLTIS